MEKKRLVLMVSVLMIVCHIFADRYKVLYVNSTDIKIESKSIAVGSVFTDKDNILWTDDQQAMKVINLSTKRTLVLAAKALKKKNASSLYEYLTSKKHLSTRTLKGRKTMEVWQTDSTLYLLDTIFLCRPKIAKRLGVAKMVDTKGHTKELSITNDNNYYIISRDILNSTRCPIRVTIMECDMEKNWEYIVYRNLIIEPITF